MFKNFVVLPIVLSLFNRVNLNNTKNIYENDVTVFSKSVYNVYLSNKDYGFNGIYLNIDFVNTNKVWSDDYASFNIRVGFDHHHVTNNTIIPETTFKVILDLKVYFTYYHGGESVGSYIYNDFHLNNNDTFDVHEYNYNKPIYASQYSSVNTKIIKKTKLNTFLKNDNTYGYYDSHWAYSVTLELEAKYKDKNNNLYIAYYDETLRF
ncbi:MAG: hypothetical protein ACTTID_03990 [Bacillales bacterium]